MGLGSMEGASSNEVHASHPDVSWYLLMVCKHHACPAGNDLNEDISPVEAGLKWTIGKRRQQSCDFLGGEVPPLTPLLTPLLPPMGFWISAPCLLHYPKLSSLNRISVLVQLVCALQGILTVMSHFHLPW